MSGKAEASEKPGNPSGEGSDKGFVALVIGNATLLTAVFIYMGWAYENSLLEHFQVSAFSLGIGNVEWVLKGLVPLFGSSYVVFAAALIVVGLTLALRGVPSLWPYVREPATGLARHAVSVVSGRAVGTRQMDAFGRAAGKHWMIVFGSLIVAVTVPLAWTGQATDSPGVFWLLLALVGTGALITAWPAQHGGLGAFTYALAIVVAAICTLWIAGEYASNLGASAAESFARKLPTETAVTVYSVQSLDLSGRGVSCKPVMPAGEYHYRCTGLRLLYVESGTYYLLPTGWNGQPNGDQTYILDDSDQVRIELSGG
jgi:hypothetical protein